MMEYIISQKEEVYKIKCDNCKETTLSDTNNRITKQNGDKILFCTSKCFYEYQENKP